MPRTLAQNRYYWGVVVSALADRMRAAGCRAHSPDDAHALLKGHFLPAGVRSTSDLDAAAFSAYVGRCRAWMFRTMGVRTEAAEGEE